MTVSLNADVRARLDAHLDAVENALIAGGCSRERRRGVVDDLEAQIMDMLASKSQSPALADLEAVLATLDPPAAYGQASSGEQPRAAAPVVTPPPVAAARPRYSRTAIAGLICILLSLVPLPLIAMAGYLQRDISRMPPEMTPQATDRPPNSPSARAPVAAPPVERALPATAVAPAGPTSGPERVPGGIRATSGATSVGGRGASDVPITVMTESRPRWALFSCVLVLFAPLGLAGTVLGWVAFVQIRGSHGMLRGQGLALFDGLFYPVLLFMLVWWLVPASIA